MLDDDELRALAALAEAATKASEHPTDYQLDDWLRECAGPLLYQREGGIRMALIEALKQLRAAASPDVVRELVARVLKAEAIVRDLAASKGYYDALNCRCVLCGESTSPSGPRNGYPDDHLLVCVCPWRRAVESQS